MTILTSLNKKIAIYHSPNSGGNEYAPLDNSLTDDGVYLFDNEGGVYQEVVQSKVNWGWGNWINGSGISHRIRGLVVEEEK